MKYLLIPLLFLLVIGCQDREAQKEQWKQEILQTEAAFAQMASEKGLEEAFLSFAADDMVLMRDNQLIIGKAALQKRFEESAGSMDHAELEWTPDFVDVSASGDMGYTYGKYKFYLSDSTGMQLASEGIFHTVWKRQEDGYWKFVWD